MNSVLLSELLRNDFEGSMNFTRTRVISLSTPKFSVSLCQTLDVHISSAILKSTIPWVTDSCTLTLQSSLHSDSTISSFLG